MRAAEALDETRRTSEYRIYRIQTTMTENFEVRGRSGNVCEGMWTRDAEERLTKAELTREIRKTIHDRKLKPGGGSWELGFGTAG
jgi:hypothetical protein